MSLGSAHHWHGVALGRLKKLVRLSGRGVRTGMYDMKKHVKGIEYNGVGWLMTGGSGWMEEFIALTHTFTNHKRVSGWG